MQLERCFLYSLLIYLLPIENYEHWLPSSIYGEGCTDYRKPMNSRWVRLATQPSDPSDNTLKVLSIRQFKNLPTPNPVASNTIAESSIRRHFFGVEKFDICPVMATKQSRKFGRETVPKSRKRAAFLSRIFGTVFTSSATAELTLILILNQQECSTSRNSPCTKWPSIFMGFAWILLNLINLVVFRMIS